MTMETLNNRGELLQIRSPAEFFAENQNIAGFDNPGKCLYTTIRELVENALDAAEAIHVLPDITVSITEMDEKAFNQERGMTNIQRVDHELYSSGKQKKRKKTQEVQQEPIESQEKKLKTDNGDAATMNQDNTPTSAKKSPSDSTTTSGRRQENFYYKIVCKDNGTGMAHDKIPDMFGRVLAGSKYGVRQTRGKFGLGAKMALIWSKKSTGLPIEIRSAHQRRKGQMPAKVSYCKLDIDIFKNEPNVIVHTKKENTEQWTGGSEITLTIGGNWTTYKSRIIQYFQQLAIITPYAQFGLTFFKQQGVQEDNKQLEFTIRYDRRSDQMPPLAKQVKHHPSALNDLLLKQLILQAKQDTLIDFMCHDLSSIDEDLALRLLTELGKNFQPHTKIKSLTAKQIHQLVRFFKQVHFKAPDGKWLSPAGEYNLRLGIMKELEPELIATHTEKPAVFEGHSFIVEAAVSIGCNTLLKGTNKVLKEGLNIYRFANRIPLLFEAGGDVVTRTAAKQINWSYYKIDQKRDKIGVFVSIVSTKIPFKGTGKEYIGDDITEMKQAVKHVLTQCCSQLRNKLVKSNRLKENQQRKKNLTKYIPDVARAFYGVLSQMKDEEMMNEAMSSILLSSSSNTSMISTNQSSILNAWQDSNFLMARRILLKQMEQKQMNEKKIQEKLLEAVQKADDEATLEHVATQGRDKTKEEDIYIQPLDNEHQLGSIVFHPLAFLRLFQ